jgi:hypothetical protein
VAWHFLQSQLCMSWAKTCNDGVCCDRDEETRRLVLSNRVFGKSGLGGQTLFYGKPKTCRIRVNALFLFFSRLVSVTEKATQTCQLCNLRRGRSGAARAAVGGIDTRRRCGAASGAASPRARVGRGTRRMAGAASRASRGSCAMRALAGAAATGRRVWRGAAVLGGGNLNQRVSRRSSCRQCFVRRHSSR